MADASATTGKVRVGTWNTELAKPSSVRGKRVRPILAAPGCDVLCVTEGHLDIFPDGGYTIEGGDDPCHPLEEGQRNVLLWSKAPWRDVECGLEMPTAGFVAGTTETPIGRLTVAGVCIPWHFACVATGCKDRPPWKVHEDWLCAFKRTPYATASTKTIVLGDFNQWIPRAGAWPPRKPSAALCQTLQGLCISTRGKLPWKAGDAHGAGPPGRGTHLWEATLDLDREGPKAGDRDQLIDHIAHTPDLVLARTEIRNGAERTVGIFPRRTPDGPLSDHAGVWADFTAG